MDVTFFQSIGPLSIYFDQKIIPHKFCVYVNVKVWALNAEQIGI